MNDLTDQQADFAVNFVANGGNGAEAARDAGYAEANARSAAYKLVRMPHVQDAIRKEQRRQLGGEMATKALSVLKGILDDDEAPYGAKVDAARTILDRAGLIAPKSRGDGEGDEKEIDQMTMAELEAKIQRWREQIDSMPVINQTSAASGAAQPLSLIDTSAELPRQDPAPIE
jgi:phage terminase small subunit